MTMTGKDKGEIPGDIKKYLTKSTNFKYVVSEGSIVVFNLRDFISPYSVEILCDCTAIKFFCYPLALIL